MKVRAISERVRIQRQLRGKRVYASDGVPLGTAMLIAECGRVMAVEDIRNLSPDLLRLVDTVCVNRDDPLNPRTANPCAAPDNGSGAQSGG